MKTPVQPPSRPHSACEQAQDILFNLQEATVVSAEEQTFLNLHLVHCRPCQAYQNDLSVLTTAMRTIEPVAVPTGLADRILAQINAPSATGPTTSRGFSRQLAWKKYGPVAAAVLLLVLVTPLLLPNGLVSPNNTASLTDLSTPLPPSANRANEWTVTDKGAAPVNETQLAQGTATYVKIGLKETYASETESDMYYDPVSTLVGF